MDVRESRKRFRVTATSKDFFYVDLYALSEDEALDIAHSLWQDDFIQGGGDWEIDGVSEIGNDEEFSPINGTN